MSVENTVFISYRRTNFYMARAVHQNLSVHSFDVFLDFDNLDSGSFSQVILNQIASRAHFVLILTPSALERCINPDDWLRKEIETAIDLKRNIVPMLFEGFAFQQAEPFMSEKMLLLPGYNGVDVPNAYFEEAMERLRSRFLSKSLDTILHPIPEAYRAVVEQKLERANSAPAPSPELIKAEEYYEKGVKAGQNGDFLTAIDEYSRAILLNPNFVEAYSERGSAYHNAGDVEKAGADWMKAVELAPDDRLTPVRRSLYFYSVEKNLQKSRDEAEKGVLLNPNDSDALAQRGLVRCDLGDYDGAIEDFNRALELNAHDLVIYMNRGVAYAGRGDYDAALADYDKALSINERDALTWIFRGQLFDNQGDYETALYNFNRAISVKPDSADAFASRAMTYHNSGDYDAAITDYTRSLELNSAVANTWNNRAFTYDAMGEHVLAIADYTRAIELAPETSVFYLNRAVTYENNGDYQTAILDYTQALSYNPGDAVIYNNRGYAYYVLGNNDAAI
ncbi:MAG TPA: tetratricopeptide repeat protein, partial [Aggregatilineales bacterium]|nr:tetratricopeptide repeat protein [Aggregatilineales bacterium]